VVFGIGVRDGWRVRKILRLEDKGNRACSVGFYCRVMRG
jgi:hypothetical protein